MHLTSLLLLFLETYIQFPIENLWKDFEQTWSSDIIEFSTNQKTVNFFRFFNDFTVTVRNF